MLAFISFLVSFLFIFFSLQLFSEQIDSFNGRGEKDMVYGCNNKLKIQWYPLIYNYKRWTYITRIILKKLSNFVQLDPFVFFGGFYPFPFLYWELWLLYYISLKVNVTILDYIWSVCCCDCDKHHFNLRFFLVLSLKIFN